MGLAGMEKQSRFYAWIWDQGRQKQEDQVGGGGGHEVYGGNVGRDSYNLGAFEKQYLEISVLETS